VCRWVGIHIKQLTHNLKKVRLRAWLRSIWDNAAPPAISRPDSFDQIFCRTYGHTCISRLDILLNLPGFSMTLSSKASVAAAVGYVQRSACKCCVLFTSHLMPAKKTLTAQYSKQAQNSSNVQKDSMFC
jgi:hypothetical protein